MIPYDSALQLANELINHRGYLVGTTDAQYRVGEVLHWPSAPEARFYVSAVTDFADYEEQVDLLSRIAPEDPPAPPQRYFHRILSD